MSGDPQGGRNGVVEPLSLPGRNFRIALGAAFIAVIGTISGLEFAEPRLTSLGSLVLLPVLAGAWLLDGPLFVAVAGLALLSRALAWSVGGLDAGTAAAESAAICLVAGTTRLAAVAMVRARATEQRLAENEVLVARLDERDRIATEIQAAAVKRLFSITLSVEAAIQEPPVKAAKRLESVVSELDQLCADMRSKIFR